MEPKFQTSFIPKKPIVPGQSTGFAVVRQTNIFTIIATIIFLVTILSAGALYFYKSLLQSQIADGDKKVDQARAAFQPDKIKELFDFNARMVAAKTLLDNHVVVSKFLHLMESDTLKNMKIDNLSYKSAAGLSTISMKAQARSYNALVQQQNIFTQSDFVKNAQFSNFSPIDDGNVTVSFMANLLPEVVSYKKAVEAIAPSQ